MMQLFKYLADMWPLVFGLIVPPPVQTTYIQYINAGQNGMPATMTGWDVDTRTFEDVSAGQTGLGFGLAVCQGVADNGCRLGLVSGRNFVGISRADPTLANVQQSANVTVDHYANGESVPVHVRGDMWVVVENAVVADQAVTVDAVTGQLGKTGGTALSNARWMSSAQAGGLAVVRLGFIAGL
jgi:hypothetical protein